MLDDNCRYRVELAKVFSECELNARYDLQNMINWGGGGA